MPFVTSQNCVSSLQCPRKQSKQNCFFSSLVLFTDWLKIQKIYRIIYLLIYWHRIAHVKSLPTSNNVAYSSQQVHCIIVKIILGKNCNDELNKWRHLSLFCSQTREHHSRTNTGAIEQKRNNEEANTEEGKTLEWRSGRLGAHQGRSDLT